METNLCYMFQWLAFVISIWAIVSINLGRTLPFPAETFEKMLARPPRLYSPHTATRQARYCGVAIDLETLCFTQLHFKSLLARPQSRGLTTQ